MITSQQFDNALKIISDYKSQLDNGLIESKTTGIFVDIQKKINRKTFFILQNYFKDSLNKKLEWDDLKAIEIDILKTMDYLKLRCYRGFGKIAEAKLKIIIDSYL